MINVFTNSEKAHNSMKICRQCVYFESDEKKIEEKINQ
jgi:hypothetical protein